MADKSFMLSSVISTFNTSPFRQLSHLSLHVECDEDKLKIPDKKSKKVYDDTPKDEVFEKFRELRFEIASKQNVPAYIVFSDKTLLEFAQALPQNKEEVLDINGVGEVKYERYGKEFLALCVEIKNEI
jgi:ATP-dependent DNA helicase RecQ